MVGEDYFCSNRVCHNGSKILNSKPINSFEDINQAIHSLVSIKKDSLKKYLNKFTEYLKINISQRKDDLIYEWALRNRECSRRIYTAVCYRVVSKSSYIKTSSPFLPIIGYYYSIFHMSLAVLYMDYTVNINELSQITHKKLKNLVTNKLIVRNVLHKRLGEFFEELQNARNYVNYKFSGNSLEFNSVNFKEKMPYFLKITGWFFEESFKFIKPVSDKLTSVIRVDIREDISEMIKPLREGFIEYINQTYLTKEDADMVINYLTGAFFFERMFYDASRES